MLGIPMEMLTMGASAIVGMVGKVMDAKAQAAKDMLSLLNKDAVTRSNSGTPTFQFTRRTIALTVTFAVVLLPKLAALGGAPVVVFTSGQEVSFLWGLFSSSAGTVLYTVAGVPITPLDTHTLAAVVGLYFGYGGNHK
jgi:hypothetical protein